MSSQSIIDALQSISIIVLLIIVMVLVGRSR